MEIFSTKKSTSDTCNNYNEVEFVIHDSDINQNRSFEDEKDVYNGNQFHPIFLLPCEREDRLYDVNKNIDASLIAINNWFEKQTNKKQLDLIKN